MSKPGFTKKVMAKLSQLSLRYPRSKKNLINNVSGDNNNNSNKRKHDVFISFKGEDTRDNFSSHLYASGDGGSRGGGGDGDGGSSVGRGDADGDNDGGDNTEGSGGGDGEMGPKVEPDFRDFRNNAGDENGYPVGQLHRRNYEKPNVCSIIPYEKNILMATAVMAAAAEAAAAVAMMATAIIMVWKNKINNVSGDNNNNSNERKHDVFISFADEDTRRDNFSSHLFEALSRQHIKTFVDYQLTGGDEISSVLLRATSKSKISVVIFSKNYASFKWCLHELAEIMRCKRMYGQIVLPVFYNVDRSHVREQTGSFKHEQDESQQELQGWRDALTEASNLPGWDLSVTNSEAALIDEIVKDVVNKLSLSDSKGPIGIDSGDGGCRGDRGDGDGGSSGGRGDADGDNVGGYNTGGSDGGGGEMGPETGPKVEPDFRGFRNNAGDENEYPVGQLHRRNYKKPNVCSIVPNEKNILMATAVMAAAEAVAIVMAAATTVAMMATAIMMVGIKLKAAAVGKWVSK